MEWIRVEDKLPESGQYVLARRKSNNWISSDLKNVNTIIVRLVKGQTAEQVKESGRVSAEDQDGNNLKPYNWQSFGTSSYFGQEITHWMPLPEPPKEESL